MRRLSTTGRVWLAMWIGIIVFNVFVWILLIKLMLAGISFLNSH